MRNETWAVEPGHRGPCRDGFEFRLGFDVEAEDAGGERQIDLGDGLANAGEHDLVGGNAGSHGPQQFAARHHVGASAEIAERLQHRLVGIRLHRVTDQRIDIGEGVGEDLVMARQRRRRIAIERSADIRGDRLHGNALGSQDAAVMFEMVHLWKTGSVRIDRERSGKEPGTGGRR